MITISQIIQEYGIEHLGRFYGTYRGIVISNTDEDNTETLKVTVPAIYDGLTTIARPKGQEGGPNTGFKYLTPKPGQIVLVEFEYGDPLRALWTYHGWATEERPEELDKDTLGIVTPNGNKVYLKEQDNTLYIIIGPITTIGPIFTCHLYYIRQPYYAPAFRTVCFMDCT